MHLDEGTIHAWLDGALDPEEALRVEQHTSECAACAAAVAEARGLVAGASRILGALDHTPGDVVPGGMRTSARNPKAPRSVWRALHFTPVRAAAAALLIVAAGTVLVARQMPNGTRSLGEDEAGPDALQPMRATGRLKLDTAPAPAPSPAAPSINDKVAERRAAESAERPARKTAAPLPAPRIAQRAEAAPTAQVRITDSTSKMAMAVASADSVASRANNVAAAPGAPRSAVVGGAAPARARIAGGVAGAAAAAPTADVEQRSLVAAPTTQAIGGCYLVEADPAAGLPGRVVLDSSAAGANTVLRLRPADSSIAARSMVKTLDASAPVAASWLPIGNGIRLSVAGSAVTPVDLHFISPTTLTGTKMVANRLVTITLHRTADCPAR